VITTNRTYLLSFVTLVLNIAENLLAGR